MTTVKKGVKAFLFKEGVQVGTVQELKVTFQRDVEGYFSINSRTSSNIKEGKLNVSGSIKKAWIDKATLALVCDSGTLVDFELKFEIEGEFYVYFWDCLFTKGAITIPQDGFITETLEFIGLTSPSQGDFIYRNLEESLDANQEYTQFPDHLWPSENIPMNDEFLFPDFWHFDYSFVNWDDDGGYIILG